MPVASLHPSLAAALALGGLDPAHFDLGLPMEGEPGAARPPRQDLMLVGREDQMVAWRVDSLTALFRGNAVPPEMKEYPPAYIPVFAFIEQRVLTMARVGRPPTDGTLEEAYSNLRRRPDGRSFGATHDTVWQIAAFTLGNYPLSGPEFDAIFGRLTKSVRNWSGGVSTRNYLAGLEKMFAR
jgi:hypothetical protein